MDVEGEMLVHPPDTLDLLVHVGSRRGGAVHMAWRVAYEASITDLAPGHYLLRRFEILHVFTGELRRMPLALDTLVTVH
jgi:hypothetical protein